MVKAPSSKGKSSKKEAPAASDDRTPASLASLALAEARAARGFGLLSLAAAGLSMATLSPSPAAALDLRGSPFVAQFSLPDTRDRLAPYTNSIGTSLLALETTNPAASGILSSLPQSIQETGGTISLTVLGSGTIVLETPNTYSGGTTLGNTPPPPPPNLLPPPPVLNGGTLSIQNSGSLGSGPVTFAGDYTLEGDGTAILTNAITVNSGISATIGATSGNTLGLTGAFSDLGGTGTTLHFGSATDTGTVLLMPVAPITIVTTGALSVDGGTLKVDSNGKFIVGSLQGGTTVGGGATQATLDLNGNGVTATNLTGNGGGVITSTGGAATLTTHNSTNSTYAGVIQDGAGGTSRMSLDVTGADGVALTLTNGGGATYTGTTTVESNGTLKGGAAGAFSSASATTVNGALDLGGFAQAVSSLSGAGSVTNSGGSDAVLTNQGASSTFSGVITDGATNKIGLTENSAGNTLTLSAANTYTGMTNITGGTLSVTGSIGSVASPSGAISIDSPGMLTVGAAGSIDIGSSSLRNAGTFTNFGNTIAGGLINTGQVINHGTLTDDLSNAGTVTNTSAYIANIAFNSGTIMNAAGAGVAWNGNVKAGANVAGGLITNQATWIGAGANAGGTIDNQATWTGVIVNTSGTFVNEGTVSAGLTNSGTATNSGAINGGVSNSSTFTTMGLVTGGLTNTGMVNASGTINDGIQNASHATFTAIGNLTTNSVFNNSGTVNMLGSQALTVPTFVNNGVLYLANGTTAATNPTINGNYSAKGPAELVLNVNGQQANFLHIDGLATGATMVVAVPLANSPSLFNGLIPFVRDNSGGATFNIANGGVIPGGSNPLVTYGIIQDPGNPNQFDLYSKLNTGAVAPVAGSVSSAISSVSTGLFQGATAFLGQPANATPNQIDGGVWTRGATGMNDQKSVATTGLVANPTDLHTKTDFSGLQVGSDLGLFNLQNSGLNLHAGVTGGEYVASSSGSNIYEGSSSYTVPFLGVYAAATGNGFFADVLLRHDFWEGEVNNSYAGLANSRMNGGGNAAIVEAGRDCVFQNGIRVTPSVEFAYTKATFDALTLFPGSLTSTSVLNVGAVQSNLGRLGLTVADVFATKYWVLTPNASASVWHEFAGPVPSVFTVSAPGQLYTQTVSDTRIGTFSQISLGLTAQPVENPSWTAYIRADYRIGGSFYGASLTGGARYQF